ncbi:MAG: hypothetical protein H0W84_02205 [Bacteroidetes bacterium]|nr:hypothetical protein [Bacteroidota bacterium]
MNYTIQQAHLYSPYSPIFLITDVPGNKFDFVNYINMNDYLEEALAFSKLYKHMSTNGFEQELFCFQRWFIIKQVIEKRSIDEFLYLDSDILLFCNADEVFGKFNMFDFTVCNKIGPQYAYFSSKNKLFKFCEFVAQLYSRPEYYKRLEEKYRNHIDHNLPGGVCDMTAFSEYQYHQLGAVKDLAVIENGAVFDDNINSSDGFEMSALGIKKIKKKGKSVFCKQIDSKKMIRFNALHFQGVGKKYVYKYYSRNNLIIQQLMDFLRDIKHRK